MGVQDEVDIDELLVDDEGPEAVDPDVKSALIDAYKAADSHRFVVYVRSLVVVVMVVVLRLTIMHPS
jgi:hypothetical protein